MSQLALPLDWPADPRDDAFLISDSNVHAAQLLERWTTWPVRTALLIGPRKSGRSLLARIFAAKTGGEMIDNAECHGEADLFHAWNRAQAADRPLVLVADAAPPGWMIRLPDLRSRLMSGPLARIGPPDEALMRAMFERQFLRRGLDARPDLVEWLVPRVERSHIAVLRTVDLLDEAVLQSRKRLSIPLARGTLAMAGLIGGPASEQAEP